MKWTDSRDIAIALLEKFPDQDPKAVNFVDLPRPRDRVELAEDARYVHYRKEVLDFLYTRHGHVERQAA